MKNFDAKLFDAKLTIAEAAVELFEEKDTDFTLNQVAKQTDYTVSEIFEYFPNKKAILRYYYESMVIRYRLMLQEIDDFEEYQLAEKLSNFAYTTFDMLEEHKKFVQQTFSSLVYCSFSTTDFEQRVNHLLKETFSSDSRISLSSSLLVNRYLYKVLYRKYVTLIKFWLQDESKDKEVSMELVDKYTAFLQEVMYSAAIDRGLDLAKFLFSNNILTGSFQTFKNMFPEIEIRD